MNRYRILVGAARPYYPLTYYGGTAGEAKRQAEALGHEVHNVILEKEDVDTPCPGVVCKCHEDAPVCPAHGRRGHR